MKKEEINTELYWMKKEEMNIVSYTELFWLGWLCYDHGN